MGDVDGDGDEAAKVWSKKSWLGRFRQNLLVIEKTADGRITRRNVAPAAFAPMTGRAQQCRLA